MELILIIDDSEIMCSIMREALGTAGYRTVTADGVDSGLALALEHEPDLILCDVMLADGKGYDVLESLQQHPRLQRVPFIFISGEAVSAGEIRAGMRMGADDYLTKPFAIQDLVDAVRTRLLRTRSLAAPSLRQPGCAGAYDALLHLLDQCSARSQPFCLIGVGLHRFERFLRLFGWQASDKLVQTLIQRLLSQFRGLTPAAFLSPAPDKFFLLWQGTIDEAAARALAQRVLDGLSEPQAWSEHTLRLSAQAGVVFGPDARAATRADLALHRAEVQGAGSIVFFASDMEQALRAHFKWEEELGLALANGNFELHYQPQFELADRRLWGAEALLRLRHPQLGMVSPATFIPVAEACGLMGPIGQWVLEAACRQVVRWWRSEGLLLKLAVNVSQVQFQSQDFADAVCAILERTGMPAASLELELTESMLMQDSVATRLQLDRLKQLGLSLAMDDFGTGYSSLALLSRLPFDLIKIDRSFVMGLDDTSESQAIPRAIIEMGRNLGLKVLAEGIETEAQWHLLQQLGCDLGQGYWYSRPLPAEQLPAFWQKSPG